MAITFLQQNKSGVVFGGNIVLAFLSNTAPGSLLVAATWIISNPGAQATLASIVDAQGNSWSTLSSQIIDPIDYGTFQVFINYAWNTIGGTTDQVTITPGVNAPPYLGTSLFEFAGAKTTGDPIDQFTDGTGTGANPSAGPITTTRNGDVCVAVTLQDIASGTGVTAAGAGWNLNENGGGGAGQVNSEYQIQSSAGSITGNFVGNGTMQFLAMIASFVPPGSQDTVTEENRWKVSIR